MPNQYKNKVIYGDQTLMDITDTTASSEDVLEGEVFYSANGARSVGTLGDATQSAHGLMSAADKTKLDGLDTALSNKADKNNIAITGSLSMGRLADSTIGPNSVAIGYNTTASGDYSHATGVSTIASGALSHAEGVSTTASGNYSHAEGNNTISSNEGSHSEGINTRATGASSHAEGNTTQASNYVAHAEGGNTIASGAYSHAEGRGGTFTIDEIEYTSGANGEASHTEGIECYAAESAAAAHAEGYQTIVSQYYSHAEGYRTVASGYSAHAEGDSTKATENSAHSEGCQTTASGSYSHSEGYETTASGYVSHAEGYETTASGRYSHTEGYNTIASGQYSHAEGDYNTVASGNASHAEGGGTQAIGSKSHAEGYYTVASGIAAHASGSYTIANQTNGFSLGFYNLQPTLFPAWVAGTSYNVGDKVTQYDNGYECITANTDSKWTYTNWKMLQFNSDVIFSIGNGVDNNNRSNACTIKTNGDAIYSGKITVGTAPTAVMDVATKGYVDNLPAATTSTSGLMSATDKTKLDGINLLGVKLNTTTLTPDANGYISIPLMTGATSNTDGTTGLIPAPTSADREKFFRGDGTWQDGGRPMVILSYGHSTWNDFITAYNNHVIVYCRASSNSNPATGSQTRMAFMAYVNNATSPTEVEFQYYRSVSSHSNTQQGDQTYVYKLTSANKWTVTVRENYTKVVAGTGLSGNWNNGAITLNASTMHGATKSQAGSAGMVPAPASGETDLYLKGDGTWGEPPTNDVDIQYNTTSKKITKTINGTTSDVVTVETLKADMDLSPLPSVTSSDNGKSLRVSNGAWAATQDIVRLANATSSDTDKTVAAADIVALESNIAKKIDKEYAEEEKCFETKTWNGLNYFYGGSIWTDGENTYYSEENYQYVLDKTTSTWSVKTWNGLSEVDGTCVWTDGENIYYSNGEDNQYILDKSTSTWNIKTWNGLNNFYGGEIWTDGENIYYSFYSEQYVLDKSTSTWSVKTWNGFSDFLGEDVWTDGENIYYSSEANHYVLDKATSTWSAKTWEGLSGFLGEDVWTDGENIYYSSEANHYVLDSTPKLLIGTNGSFTPITLQSFMIDAVASNAGAHNGIYRGKCLGTAVTSAQYSAISSGTFDDLYIGDYWTIGDHNWVICDFDYYIRCGSVDVDQHHLVMMPSKPMCIPDGTALYGASGTLTHLVGEDSWTMNWNATSEAPFAHTTAGGYKYSRMRTVIMKAANTIVIDAFGSEHVLPFTELYYSPAAATDSGLASGWAWFADDDQSSAMSKSICDLCNETMVYGQQVWGRGSAYTNVGFEIGLDKFQLAIFALNRNFANTRYDWWLRSVASATQAACVSNYGTADLFSSASSLGVRPRFLLVG